MLTVYQEASLRVEFSTSAEGNSGPSSGMRFMMEFIRFIDHIYLLAGPIEALSLVVKALLHEMRIWKALESPWVVRVLKLLTVLTSTKIRTLRDEQGGVLPTPLNMWFSELERWQFPLTFTHLLTMSFDPTHWVMRRPKWTDEVIDVLRSVWQNLLQVPSSRLLPCISSDYFVYVDVRSFDGDEMTGIADGRTVRFHVHNATKKTNDTSNGAKMMTGCNPVIGPAEHWRVVTINNSSPPPEWMKMIKPKVIMQLEPLNDGVSSDVLLFQVASEGALQIIFRCFNPNEVNYFAHLTEHNVEHLRMHAVSFLEDIVELGMHHMKLLHMLTPYLSLDVLCKLEPKFRHPDAHIREPVVRFFHAIAKLPVTEVETNLKNSGVFFTPQPSKSEPHPFYEPLLM